MPLASRFVRENESLDTLEGIGRFISRACIGLPTLQLEACLAASTGPTVRRPFARSRPLANPFRRPLSSSKAKEEREERFSRFLPLSRGANARQANRVAVASRQSANHPIFAPLAVKGMRKPAPLARSLFCSSWSALEGSCPASAEASIAKIYRGRLSGWREEKTGQDGTRRVAIAAGARGTALKTGETRLLVFRSRVVKRQKIINHRDF